MEFLKLFLLNKKSVFKYLQVLFPNLFRTGSCASTCFSKTKVFFRGSFFIVFCTS